MISRTVLGSLILTLFTAVNAHANPPDKLVIPESFFSQELDTDLGEAFEDNDFEKEKQYITNTAETFLKFIRDVRAQNNSPLTTRGAHAKALACLKGEFEVQNQGLPATLRVGLFSSNKTYKTWIRVSNSSQDPFSKDLDQKTRGFAMKLLDVPGPKILGTPQDTNLDLLNVAAEAFVAKDNSNYSQIADETEGNLGLIRRLGLWKVKDLLVAVFEAQHEYNPLRLTYFSTVPYRLGPAQSPKVAIKFRVTLCDPKTAGNYPAASNGDDNLIKNISQTLEKNSVCYNFQVQKAGLNDQVEDATSLWSTPYVTIAKIRIQSTLNQPDAIAGRKTFCENLSFNPWRTLEEHRPLGRINRARKTIYLLSSSYRRTENKAPTSEPTASSFETVP